ncbi:MAG TPA: methylmalonyl-CoA epimerase [Deltaproteobacteria bacterium]|nr:methylmalonyl-CoA epimerase [Deltaproteobacteria bacterium]
MKELKFKKIDHVAIAVPDLDKGIALYQSLLGKKPEHIEEVADQKVRAAFFGVGESNLELLFPTDPASPISNFLQKNGRGGLHHICLEVENIEERLKELKAKGVVLIDEKPRIGAHGKRIAFVHPKSTGGVLIELSETTLRSLSEVEANRPFNEAQGPYSLSGH